MIKGAENEPIRVLQYIGSLDPGGSQTMIMNIYRSIDRSKVQFDFVIDRKDDKLYVDEIKSLGGKVYVFDEYFKGSNYFSFTKQWRELFDEHPEYRIIHCHVRSVASIVLKIAKKHGLRTVCHSHSTSNGRGVKAIAKKIFQSRIYKYCDYYLACSKESARWLYGENITKTDKCLILNNAIDALKYKYDDKVRKKVRNQLGLNDKIVLGQVGRIEPVKNYIFSLDLLKKLLDKNCSYHLLIVGSGSQKNEIMKKIKELGLSDYVTILENRNDVNELMQAMDVFIMPSLWEGLPMALVEAQAASLPCVISNAINDGIIDKDLVKRLDINDYEEWRDVIEELVEQKNVKRKNNYGLIEKSGFDIKENVKMVSNFYIDMLKLRSRKVFFCLGSMEHGGAERVVANLCNYFVKDNIVKIIVTKRWKPEYDLDDNIGHFVLDNGNNVGFLRRTICRVKKLRNIIKGEKPDIVIAFLPEPSFRLMVAKTFLSVKTIISVRNDPNVEYDTLLKKILVRILYTKADGFVFQTPDAQKWFSKKIQKKSVVIPNPVNESFLREPYGGVREKRIVTVGRLVEQKNQKLLIDAFSEFYKKHKDYKLEIYGDGPLRAELMSYINELGLSNVIGLMGEVPDVGNRIYKAKMFVLTSDYEGMPNALMEAMALGLPCISTDCPIGGPSFLINNGKNGLLVPINSTAQISEAMCQLEKDIYLTKIITESASKSCERFAIYNIVKMWNNYIFTITDGDVHGSN